MSGPTSSRARCSRLLNALRSATGAIVPYDELRDTIWPPPKQPRSWKSQLATFAFMLRELGYPVGTAFNQGFRFVPAREPAPRQQRPVRQKAGG